MYKSRFYLWMGVLLVVIFIKTIMSIDISSLIIESKDVSVNVDTNTFFKSDFLASKTGQIKFVQTTNNPLIYVKESSNEELEGYDKIENAIYSPILLYVPVDEELNSDVYYTLGNSSKFVSFPTIANAILEDLPLSTFGVEDKDLKDQTIILNIPSKDSFYYDAIVEQIYVALNNNRVPTEEEREALKPRVDTLLSKCVECNDMVTKIDELKDDSYNIFIAPEFLADNSSDIASSSGYNYFNCVHFEKTVCLSYDLFVKEDSLFGEEKLIDIVHESVFNNEDFIESIDHRTQYDHNYDYLFNGTQSNNLDIYFMN